MNLPRPGPVYSGQDEAKTRNLIEIEDKKNVKQGAVFDKILMKDTVTGASVAVTVASGVLVVT